MQDTIAVINAGSSSIKFALFTGAELTRCASGSIDNIGSAPHFRARDAEGNKLIERHWDQSASEDTLFEHLLAWIENYLGGSRLRAAGHRILHGGPHHSEPVLLTQEVIAELYDTIPLAPLHEPYNLAPVAALERLYPGLPQVGCFDTAFHSSNPRCTQLYALPRALAEAGVRRYGFHGLSYEFIAGELARHDARAAAGRTVVAHLGSGASLCALLAGRSMASSMGFTALDGVPMGTRCGAIDPGVLLYLLQEQHYTPGQLSDLLYRQSGLLGLSGISADMRDLLASDDARAREAVEVFVYRVAREVASLLVACGGIDALVFTAGIGQHAPTIRARICQHLDWLGIRLDEAANRADALHISSADSAVAVWVLPTDEELMIARHSARLVTARA